jgi:hypothetical protein
MGSQFPEAGLLAFADLAQSRVSWMGHVGAIDDPQHPSRL